MNSINNIPCHTRGIPSQNTVDTQTFQQLYEMLQIEFKYGSCLTKHISIARMNTIYIPTPPRASCITVGMHLVHNSAEPIKCAKQGPANTRRLELYLLLTLIKFQ